MPFITTIPPESAQGELEDLYGELSHARGKIANILQVHSLRPRALRAHMALYMDVMFAAGGLSRREREFVAVVVSQANQCDYCVAHHAEALSRYVTDHEFLEALDRGEIPAESTPRERALAAFARKLTRAPGSSSAGDVESLRAVGLADAVLLANLVVAYFNFVNRIALGLGVEATPAEVSGYDA